MHWVNAISGHLGRRANRNACTDTRRPRKLSFPISDGGHPDPTHPRRPDPPLPLTRASYTSLRGLLACSALDWKGMVRVIRALEVVGNRVFRVEGSLMSPNPFYLVPSVHCGVGPSAF